MDLLATNTWAERNPNKPTQQTRVRPKPTESQKNAQKITAERNRQARVALAPDITGLVASRKQQIKELATQHNITVQHIQKLIKNTTHYKKARAPNLSNALVHMKAKELNEGT
jgi:K+-transporting ATPase c subunit